MNMAMASTGVMRWRQMRRSDNTFDLHTKVISTC